jgi:hypothetical protein
MTWPYESNNTCMLLWREARPQTGHEPFVSEGLAWAYLLLPLPQLLWALGGGQAQHQGSRQARPAAASVCVGVGGGGGGGVPGCREYTPLTPCPACIPLICSPQTAVLTAVPAASCSARLSLVS